VLLSTELIQATVTGLHVDSRPARSETCAVPAIMTQDYRASVSPGIHQNNTLNDPQSILRMEQSPLQWSRYSLPFTQANIHYFLPKAQNTTSSKPNKLTYTILHIKYNL